MLIDRYLPTCDVTEIQEVTIDAPLTTAYWAIREADLKDPVVSALFAVRRWRRGRRARRPTRGTAGPSPAGITLGAMVEGETGLTLLAEEPHSEFVVGSIGGLWRRDYGGRRVDAHGFTAFSEPGYAKLAMSFRVRPRRAGGTILRYEARTATTDPAARRALRRYWKLIHPGVSLIMHRALLRIKEQAEARASDARRSLAGVSPE